MKKFFLLLLLPLLLTASFVTVNEILLDSAEAARFGGGRSFGGSAFSRSAPAPAPVRQAPAANAVQGSPTRMAGSPIGGMLGPLLAGTMLGSLLMGGAFNGIGGMDILIVGVAIFLITRLLRSRRQAAAAAQSNYSSYDASAGRWDKLREAGGSGGGFTAARTAEAEVSVPADFDVQDFIKGAKIMFTRMQESWDKRDLEDIALFTSAAVLKEIENQAAEDPEPAQTDIMMINARLLDFKQNEIDAEDTEGARDRAVVFFEVLLRENQTQDTEEVREIWHFIRHNQGAEQGEWKLGGLQQVV
ncbi:MAG: TIM44-like domain-containing protein [Deltaproteobacteria bacterium]|nr:TIM44-like domain-containing protein [Deltaproteobacteria bacterium]